MKNRTREEIRRRGEIDALTSVLVNKSNDEQYNGKVGIVEWLKKQERLIEQNSNA